MPEFVFEDKAGHGGMYMPLYRYFLSRWQHPDIPEYDLDTDELVYHDQLGYEVLRERFDGKTFILPEEDRAEGVSGSVVLDGLWGTGTRAGGRVIPSER
ncbi:MAG: hypothetical protein A2010_11620 [Nitrospirae bacterium GWD2_57_9]|nr:MAG: hypothetical protein A2010_11620 [Nitrospirae bacterium GWD2_57_9]